MERDFHDKLIKAAIFDLLATQYGTQIDLQRQLSERDARIAELEKKLAEAPTP